MLGRVEFENDCIPMHCGARVVIKVCGVLVYRSCWPDSTASRYTYGDAWLQTDALVDNLPHGVYCIDNDRSEQHPAVVAGSSKSVFVIRKAVYR